MLANVALHVLDEVWQREGWRLGVLVRYADDLVVLCPTESEAEQARQRVAEILVPLGLRLHPDKTRIVCLSKGQKGFDFLASTITSGVLEMAGPLLPATLAVGTGKELDPGGDP